MVHFRVVEPLTMDHTVGELAASQSKRLRDLPGGPAVGQSRGRPGRATAGNGEGEGRGTGKPWGAGKPAGKGSGELI